MFRVQLLEAAGCGGGAALFRGTLRGVDDEREALRWLTVDELAAARRRAIKQLNLLDRSAADYAETATALKRTIDLVGQVQAERRQEP